MKKIILFLLLISSLYSDAKVYMGLGAGFMNEAFSDNANSTNSAEMGKIKIGYGDREAYAIEFSFDYLKNDESIFSTTGEDSDKFGMNIELIKSVNWDIYILPYFKVGIGSGYFDISADDQTSLNYSSVNFGLGFLVPVNEHVDFEVGYDYKYVSYEELTSSGEQIGSHLNGVFTGINFRF